MTETSYRNPVPTVDIVIEVDGGIVLVFRKNPPRGWALPGGYVDYGEMVQDAARREALEETGLSVMNLLLLGVYSDPARDMRRHTVAVAFYGVAQGEPVAGDDAELALVFPKSKIPDGLVADHEKILSDYFLLKERGVRPM